MLLGVAYVVLSSSVAGGHVIIVFASKAEIHDEKRGDSQADHFVPCSFVAVKKNEPKDIRNFDYTARSWTGKSPKQFLIDWVRKNLPKSPPPAFHKVAAGRYWRCK